MLLNRGEQNLHDYAVEPISKHVLVAFLYQNNECDLLVMARNFAHALDYNHMR